MNKKSTIMLIIGIIVTVPIIVGSTYAYYLSTTKSNNSALNTNASNFEVIYTGGEEITGPINLSKSREQGLNTSVKINEDSITTKIKCPECGGDLIFEGGCNTCKDCGYSKCG